MNPHIKNAFSKVKEDINFLNDEILKLKTALNNLEGYSKNLENTNKNLYTELSTIRQIIKTHIVNPTHNPTVPQEIQGLKQLNLSTSTGNKGVPTDRQTDTPTDTPTHFLSKKGEEIRQKSIEKNIKEASQILDSLDGIRKEIRLKFKQLTSQEMLVFTTIYQLEEQHKEYITYEDLSRILKLSESSIRDYTQRIINKEIPIKKTKINNKRITLNISPELKKIASLSTIIKLREL